MTLTDMKMQDMFQVAEYTVFHKKDPFLFFHNSLK